MNTFLNKVDAEREVLRIVNQVTTRRRQLAGLSAGAISNWQTRNDIPFDHDCIPLLLELADVCQTLSDRSNENFLPLPKGKNDAIHEGIKTLRNMIDGLAK
jgi:hypothetical protein